MKIGDRVHASGFWGLFIIRFIDGNKIFLNGITGWVDKKNIIKFAGC